MKTWFNKILAFTFFGFGLYACNTADDPIRKTATTAPELTSSVTSVVLKSEAAGTDAFTLTWSAADYGYVATVTYTIQLAKKGNNFSEVTEIAADSTALKQTYTNNIPGWKMAILAYNFDKALSQLGITSASADVEIRIKSVTKTSTTPVYSNAILLGVSPYTDVVVTEPVLTSSTTTFNQSSTDPVVFTWTASEYSLDDPIVYTLQFDTNEDFEGAIETSITGEVLTKSYSIADFNNLAKQAGLVVKTAGTIYVRLKSTQTGSFTNPAYSNTLAIAATPFNIYPENLYLVGGSTSAGWVPGNSVPFVKTDDGKFEIYAYLTVAGDGLKFLQIQDWAGDWGKSKTIAGGLEQDTEDNVTVAQDGFYLIKCDFTNKTYSVTLTTWGIIGDATGSWNDDTDMIFVGGSESYTWAIDITLTTGAYKFRANNGWDINYGYGGSAGQLQFNGSNNIPSPGAGSYHIELILDPVNGYRYTITPN